MKLLLVVATHVGLTIFVLFFLKFRDSTNSLMKQQGQFTLSKSQHDMNMTRTNTNAFKSMKKLQKGDIRSSIRRNMLHKQAYSLSL